MMEPTAADISLLVSDLEGLARVAASAKKGRNASQGTSLPSLEQLYRLGLLLFQINASHKRKSSSIDGDPVATAYRELMESVPDESLRSLFGDLRRAVQALLETANKSTPRSIGTSSRAGGSSDAARDLAMAVRSIEGLIGAFSDSDSRNLRETESNSRICRVVYDKSWISTLSGLYDRFVVFEKQQQNKQRQQPVTSMVEKEIESTKRAILSCLSRLILDGLILAGGDGGATAQVEESLMGAIQSMETESTDCLRDLQAWQTREEPFRRNLENSIRAIDSNDMSGNKNSDEGFVRAQQRQYILSILESARGEPSSMAIPASSADQPRGRDAKASNQKRPSASAAGTTELDRRVQQVLQILPHFGEGFVEVALGLHKGEVEATVATLLNHPTDGNPPDSSYPTALRVLDPKLPRRKREFRAYQTAEEEAIRAEEARRDVKERIALEEKQKRDQYEALVVMTEAQQQEAAAAAAAGGTSEEAKGGASASEGAAPADNKKKNNSKPLTRKELRQQKLRKQRRKDVYDDDYDDQYDEIDIRLGAADDGFTTDNYASFEQVKLYNKIVQEEESDAAFWESNRNSNQTGGGKSSSNSNSNSNDEKKWGPDKIKGGRVIGADGKIVRKPGGVKKKKGNNNRNNNSNNNNNNANTNNEAKGNNNNNNNNNNNGGQKGKPNANNNNANNAANNGNKKKPKTKPRSDNRVNRQRDRKLKKQGAFGVQD